MNTKESDGDKNHRVRMACASQSYRPALTRADGNGMPPDVWMNFKKRFNIPVVNEFYGALATCTE